MSIFKVRRSGVSRSGCTSHFAWLLAAALRETIASTALAGTATLTGDGATWLQARSVGGRGASSGTGAGLQEALRNAIRAFAHDGCGEGCHDDLHLP